MKIVSKQLRGLFIAQMSRTTRNPILQILRIRTVAKHLRIEISLYHQVVRPSDIIAHLLRGRTNVRHHAESFTLSRLDAITHIVRRIMRKRKRRHPQARAQIERDTLLDIHVTARIHLPHRLMTLTHPLVHLRRGIHQQVQFVAHVSRCLDVVGMVVCHQDAAQDRGFQAIFSNISLQSADSYPRINQYSVSTIAQIRAVAATSTAKTYKL